MAPKPQSGQSEKGSGSYHHTEFDIDTWIRGHNLDVCKEGSWNGGRKWILGVCPWNASHTDRSSYILQMPGGALSAGCHHNGCKGLGWKELRALYEKTQPNTASRGSYSSNGNGNGKHEHRVAQEEATVDTSTGEILTPEWPEPPGEAAYLGLAGRLVNLIDPYTEASRVGVLGNLLTFLGCAIGRGPHAQVGATRHDARIFLTQIGRTSKGRKGESLSPVRALFDLADPEWASNCISSGLSSGEGMLVSVRDAVEKMERIKGSSLFERVVVDEGVEDKRRLIIEPEFARVLQTIRREGNTLSPLLRDGWDRGDLQSMTKTPIKATGAHISLITQITMDELRRELTATDTANGFMNRFIVLAVKRSKLIPEPRVFVGGEIVDAADEIRAVLTWARQVGRIERDADARELWAQVYASLSAERDGLAWAVLARAEAQVLRLSLLYALINRSHVVGVPHLVAALDLWDYAERSALYVFGDAVGDPVADTILAALKRNRSLTRTDISKLFSGNASSNQIGLALSLLERNCKARMSKEAPEEGKGRTIEVWSLVD